MAVQRVTLLMLTCVCLAAAASAQSPQPVANWAAPASWTPGAGGVPPSGSGTTRSASTLDAINSPMPFIPVTPCRLIDTRHGPIDISASPARGTYTTGEVRTYDPSQSSACTGLPTSAGAWSLMFQYTTSAVSGGPASFLTAWPAGTTMPSPQSTLLGYADRWTANSAIIPGGSPDSSISVYAQKGGDVIIDINGYYARNISLGYFGITGSYTNAGLIYGENDATTGGNTSSVRAYTPNGGAGASGVLGAYGGAAGGYGVEGESVTQPNAAGVVGRDQDATPTPFGVHSYISAGVRGESAGDAGVIGLSNYMAGGFENFDVSNALQSWAYLGFNGLGVSAATNLAVAGNAGVSGQALATGVQLFGVRGSTAETGTYGSAGVYGYVSGQTLANATGYYASGVRGESAARGVMGLTYGTSYGGVWGGYFANQTDVAPTTYSMLGYNGTYGLYTVGSTYATGSKSFLEPHPSDPTKAIRYISLEGNEAGTYFRGRGAFSGHQAVIQVPEDFRIVTDAAGLSIQVTPIGDFASVAVVRIGLDEIVLKSTADVEFFYTVNGLRKAYKELEPIIENQTFFVPESADARLPLGLSTEAQQRLISNGTYNADGTVNMDTAKRLGWAKSWEERDLQKMAEAEAAAIKRQAAEPPTVVHAPATQQP